MNNGWLKNFLKKIKLNESTISMILGILVIAVIGALIFNYFRGVSELEEAEMPPLEEISEIIGEGEELGEKTEELSPKGLPTTHQVVKGEHLWSIAEKYYGSGYNWVDIAKENNLLSPNDIAADQELNIPNATVIRAPAQGTFPTKGSVLGNAIGGGQYTVVEGDHLWAIAIRAYGDGYKWLEIAQANNLDNPSLIHPGNILTLPR